jgi:hypothetical protein
MCQKWALFLSKAKLSRSLTQKDRDRPACYRFRDLCSACAADGCIPLVQDCPHPPAPSPNFERRGARFKVPLPELGEGFRVRATQVGCTPADPLEPHLVAPAAISIVPLA